MHLINTHLGHFNFIFFLLFSTENILFQISLALRTLLAFLVNIGWMSEYESYHSHMFNYFIAQLSINY